MPAGRPLKFETVADLQNKINEYFLKCDNHTEEVLDKDGKIIRVAQPIPYTITGLALYLDTSRETLINYEDKPEYFDTIKKAKQKIEEFNERLLYRNGNNTGVIFNLKNNFGWSDKTEVTNTNININKETIMTDEELEAEINKLKSKE